MVEVLTQLLPNDNMTESQLFLHYLPVHAAAGKVPATSCLPGLAKKQWMFDELLRLRMSRI